MSEIELKARELLAEMARGLGQPEYAYHIGCGGVLDKGDRKLIAPIIAALTPQWQPIETAPRDGRAILMMRNEWPGCKNGVAEECNGHNTYVAEWWAGERNGEGAWICYMVSWKDPECPVEPTHWMPLPSPPEFANVND